MKKDSLILVTSILLLVLVLPTHATQTCLVEITVKEYSTGQPIPGATVAFGATTYITDSNGVVSFSVTIGSHYITVSKPGYRSATISLNCQSCGNVVRRTVYLAKGACQTYISVSLNPRNVKPGDALTISGTVSGASGEAVYVYVDERYVATVFTTPAGYYSYTYTVPSWFSSGTHVVRVDSRVNGCEMGSATDSFSVSKFCSLDVYIWDQNHVELNANVYVDGVYVGFGSHLITQLSAGVHTVSASSPGYTSSSATISCTGEAVRVDLVLTEIPTQVCAPGSITNRRCISSTQVSYEKCKADGSGWETIVEECPPAYTCSNGFCIQQQCVEMYLDAYRCSGNWLQRLYQYPDCHTEWKNYDYCTYGCSNGACLSPPSWVCGSWSACVNNQQTRICWDQYGNKRTEVRTCLVSYEEAYPKPSCVLKVIAKKCVDNYRMEEYQLTDCRTSWEVAEFCPYGCIDGECLPPENTPSLQVDEIYEVKPCEVVPITFSVSNLGAGRTIKLRVEGTAAEWIHVPGEITVESGETRRIVALADIPCNISGKYDFTIIAEGTNTAVAPSILSVEEKAGLPVTTLISPSPQSLAIIALIVLFLLLVWRVRLPKDEEEKFYEKD